MEFTPENRLRAERLLLFCWQEQLIDRGCLTKCLVALKNQNDQSCLAELKTVLPSSVLSDTHRRISGYAEASAQLLEQLHDVQTEKIRPHSSPVAGLSDQLGSRPLTSATGASAVPEISTVAMVPEPPPEAPTGGSADLQVSMLPRLMGPITAVLLVVLGFFVFGAFQSVSDYFTGANSETDPTEQLTGTSNTQGQPIITPDETTLEVVPTPQTGMATNLNLREALDRLIPFNQWQEAIDVLNSPRYRQRDQRSILWEATVLAGTGEQQNIDDALRMICARTNIQSGDSTWLQLYAMLLLSSTEKARELAVQSITQSSSRAMQLPQTLRVLDWAKARDGEKEAELDALRKRLADFTADSLDHFFLAYSNLNDSNSDQARYHIGKARQKYQADYVPDENHPEWLHDMCDEKLLEAIDKLRDRLSESS